MTDKQKAAFLEEKVKLLMRHSFPLAQWASKYSPDDATFANAIGTLSTIRDIEEFLTPTEEPKKWEQLKLM